MIGISIQKLMILLRLAVITALAGYTLPTSSFAMHGDSAASYSRQSTLQVDYGAHSHDGMASARHAHVSGTSHPHPKSLGQGCCSDLCVNLALGGDVATDQRDKAPTIRVYSNDGRVITEPIRLNRPPASRA